jgi:hypothetical protein
MGEDEPIHPDNEKIRTLLSKISASRYFARSRQLVRLLEYLIENSLRANAGASRSLKEYTIALAVFGRDQSFEPATDTIVRSEMRRLRSKLAAYFEDEGLFDPFLIEVPKGSYAVAVRRRSQSETLDLSGKMVSHYRLIKACTAINGLRRTKENAQIRPESSELFCRPAC